MVAVLDACTILNILQVTLDERYIVMIEKVFDEIVIPNKVYEEIQKNKSQNLVDSSSEKQLSSIIHSHILKHVDFAEPVKEVRFVTKALGQLEKNGEFYSICHCLSRSRSGTNHLREFLLKTSFITDDLPAETAFSEFYKINIMGQIMNSIDLLTLFCLKGFIGPNEVLKFCNSLKLLYNKNATLLLHQLKEVNEKYEEILDLKERSIITEIITQLNDLSDYAIERINTLVAMKEFKSISKKCSNLPSLVAALQKSNFREKIPEINKRMKYLEHVYELNY